MLHDVAAFFSSLPSKLGLDSLTGWTTRWVEIQFDDHAQSTVVNGLYINFDAHDK